MNVWIETTGFNFSDNMLFEVLSMANFEWYIHAPVSKNSEISGWKCAELGNSFVQKGNIPLWCRISSSFCANYYGDM